LPGTRKLGPPVIVIVVVIVVVVVVVVVAKIQFYSAVSPRRLSLSPLARSSPGESRIENARTDGSAIRKCGRKGAHPDREGLLFLIARGRGRATMRTFFPGKKGRPPAPQIFRGAASRR